MTVGIAYAYAISSKMQKLSFQPNSNFATFLNVFSFLHRWVDRLRESRPDDIVP
jgi:hypothetical protein